MKIEAIIPFDFDGTMFQLSVQRFNFFLTYECFINVYSFITLFSLENEYEAV